MYMNDCTYLILSFLLKPCARSLSNVETCSIQYFNVYFLKARVFSPMAMI